MRGLLSALALALGLAACSTPAPSHAPAAAWRTDFTRLADGVTLSEFIRAAPVRDGIPALDEPKLVAISSVDWIGDAEPVIAVEAGGAWRAYPLQILIWHEIANDALGGMPITVTFCPLCHTAVVFERMLAGTILDFGVTGYLRRSDLVMYDRQTESWWQQATGVGLAGNHAGERLEILPSSLVSWSVFAAAHPDATVLDRDTGFERPYGTNPYPGWDRVARNPLLGAAQLERCDRDATSCIDPKERVGVVTVKGEAVVYTFRRVSAAGGLVEDRVGGVPIVVWWLPDVQSVLDNALLSRSDQVGTLVAFDRRVDGGTLSLEQDGELLRDPASGATWDALGHATSPGPADADLTRLQLDTPYWFGFAAFGSGYRIWSP